MRIIILNKPFAYKGFHIIAQTFGTMFQAFIFKDGQFYSVTNDISYSEGKSRFTTKQLESGARMIIDQAIATCELILNKATPEKMHKAAKRKAKTQKQKDMLNASIQYAEGEEKAKNLPN